MNGSRWAYRYLPLPLYWLLWAAYWLVPRARWSLEERLAIRLLPPRGRRAIWFHAASVGEVSTIAPVVAETLKSRPGVPVVVTTVTQTGARRAAKEIGEAEVALLPFDFLPCMRRFVTALEPSCLVIGETEIWPNLVAEVRRRGAPVVLVNGRISDRSYPRYRLIRALIGDALRDFDLLLMRTRRDADRIVALGASADRVQVIGNTKYDMLPGPMDAVRRREIRRSLGIGDGTKVVTLGSAREGETEILLEAMSDPHTRSAARAIVAPRHLEMVPRIEELCRSRGFDCRLISDLAAPAGAAVRGEEVLVLARMGLLLETYGISDIALVGGTFGPYGGHNPLEPASQGCVTVVGPHTQNIQDDMTYLIERSCAVVVGEGEAPARIAGLVAGGEELARMGRAAIAAVGEKKGVAARCVAAMDRRGVLSGGQAR
ncbi:MAG: glycosyltransferase N-terminal domain-containing protein [bacterium]